MGSLLKIIVSEDLTSKSTLPKQSRTNRTENSSIKKFNISNFNKEIIPLSSIWKEIVERHKNLEVSAYFISLDNYKYAKYFPDKVLPAASTIKIIILIETLRMLDKGELAWNEPLELKKELIGGGAGWMAYESLGTFFPIHEVATEMIRVSDNTAANLLIYRLGGINNLNQSMKEMGLKRTQINNLLPDLNGTNTTTSKELAITIAMAESGKILTPRSRDLFREIMGTSTSNKLLPAGILKGLGKEQEKIDYNLLIKGFRVYNKTGDIGISYSDAGLIQMPDNTRAIAGFIVKGPFNDPNSPGLIKDLASAIVQVIKPESLLDPTNENSN